MANPLWKRLRDLDWKSYEVTLAQSKDLQRLLQDLASHKEVRAMRASQTLWSLLKPGSKAVPAVLPFLQEIRGISAASVRGEIDDLLRRCEASQD